MQADFDAEVHQLNMNEKEIKLSLDESQRENSELKKKLEEETQLCKKLQ